jgi:hypothetical protein
MHIIAVRTYMCLLVIGRQREHCVANLLGLFTRQHDIQDIPVASSTEPAPGVRPDV